MHNTIVDDRFMSEALSLAERAAEDEEVPIGAVVVSPEGIIIGKGYNKTEQLCSQSRHAEVMAIEEAGSDLGDWRLEGCVLYVTVQPCLMCMALICLSRIERLVYGAESPLFGYSLDKEMLPELYKKHIKGITSGILAQEAQKYIENFFKRKRKRA